MKKLFMYMQFFSGVFPHFKPAS